jgi:hypothetical protein
MEKVLDAYVECLTNLIEDADARLETLVRRLASRPESDLEDHG